MTYPEIEKEKSHIIVEIIQYIPNAVLSKTIIKKTTGNITASSFDAGEELAEKTSPFDNYIQIIDGTAEIIDDQELLEQSNTNFKAKKYTRCIKSLSELIRRNPYNPSLYVMRAKSYELLGETENACADYDYLRCFLNYTLHKQTPCQ